MLVQLYVHMYLCKYGLTTNIEHFTKIRRELGQGGLVHNVVSIAVRHRGVDDGWLVLREVLQGFAVHHQGLLRGKHGTRDGWGG